MPHRSIRPPFQDPKPCPVFFQGCFIQAVSSRAPLKRLPNLIPGKGRRNVELARIVFQHSMGVEAAPQRLHSDFFMMPSTPVEDYRGLSHKRVGTTVFSNKL